MASDQGLRVALGDDVYRVERPFGDVAPAEGRITDVAVDLSGHVHVLVRRDALVEAPGPSAIVFDHSGRRLRTWGTAVDAHMLSCDAAGRLWIVDRDAHVVTVHDADGTVTGELGGRGRPASPFNHPADIAVGPSGDVYVADGYGHGFVHRFDASLRPVGRWGGVGTRPGEFLTAHGIWVMQDGRVVVVDRENNRLQVFSPAGELLYMLDGFHRPSDIWGDAQGRLYVTDAIPTLTRLTPDLRPDGRCRPVLNGAHGLWGAPDGTIYLAESNPNRVTRLVPER